MNKTGAPPLSFLELPSSKTLKELAKKPYDFRKEKLTRERIASFTASKAPFTLLYGTERITEEVMEALFQLAKETKALEKMHSMQNGEKVNSLIGYPSEDREVLHTALRDFFGRENVHKTAARAAREAKEQLNRVESYFAKMEKNGTFDTLLVIGIGGSNLGPEACATALSAYRKKGRNVLFISNVDPDDVFEKLAEVDLHKTLTLLISKSGATLETLTNESIVANAYKKCGIDPKERMITATKKGSPYDDEKKYAACFLFWDFVGGRFSTSSCSGMIIFTFLLGFEAAFEFLKGAHEMDKAACSEDLRNNIPLLLALLSIWNRNFLNHPMIAVVPYSYALRRFAAHIQQVDMESNGKHIDRWGRKVLYETGPIPFGEPGTNAQHSFFQLLHQGTTIVPLEFLAFKEPALGKDEVYQETTSQQKLLSNVIAQAVALAEGMESENPNKEFEGNRPSHILAAKKCTPFTVGALLALFEHKVAFQGFILGINSFDQEGVQLGKVLANKLLKSIKEKDPSLFPEGSAILQFIERA